MPAYEYHGEVSGCDCFGRGIGSHGGCADCGSSCSGLGVLRRKTDIKYRMNPEGEESLVALQRQILSVVCEYVKPGGTLIYSTCTIHTAENEGNARWFEQTHPEFALDTMRQMFPEEHLGDGFFIAKFKRKQDNG